MEGREGGGVGKEEGPVREESFRVGGGQEGKKLEGEEAEGGGQGGGKGGREGGSGVIASSTAGEGAGGEGGRMEGGRGGGRDTGREGGEGGGRLGRASSFPPSHEVAFAVEISPDGDRRPPCCSLL